MEKTKNKFKYIDQWNIYKMKIKVIKNENVLNIVIMEQEWKYLW